jgi:hypothetical protein
MYTLQHNMATFAAAHEVMAVLLHGGEKRRVHFRIIDTVLPTGTERRFGLTEYLYCDKHCTWHEQKNEAFVPIGDWSKLVGFTELLDVYAKPIVEQMLSEKSNGVEGKNESAAEPEHKEDEILTPKSPPPQQYCDDGYGHAIAVGYGCAPTGTPEQR